MVSIRMNVVGNEDLDEGFDTVATQFFAQNTSDKFEAF